MLVGLGLMANVWRTVPRYRRASNLANHRNPFGDKIVQTRPVIYADVGGGKHHCEPRPSCGVIFLGVYTSSFKGLLNARYWAWRTLARSRPTMFGFRIKIFRPQSEVKIAPARPSLLHEGAFFRCAFLRRKLLKCCAPSPPHGPGEKAYGSALVVPPAKIFAVRCSNILVEDVEPLPEQAVNARRNPAAFIY